MRIIPAVLSAGLLLGCQRASPTLPRVEDPTLSVATVGEAGTTGPRERWITLAGVVVDPTGECVTATVRIVLGPGAGRGTTQHGPCAWWDYGDDLGFRLARVPSGRSVVLRASATGFADRVVTLVSSPDMVRIELTPLDEGASPPDGLTRRLPPD